MTNYGMIAPMELTYNYKQFTAPYDSNLPIETLFQHIQNARAFVITCSQSYGAMMIVNIAYTLLGLFPDTCHQ
jgi:hypothetical protein